MRRYAEMEKHNVAAEGRGAGSGPVSGLLAQTADKGFSLSALASHFRMPLYRNAYAWLISTGGSSALGIVYWVVAAHVYSAETVGINAALVSAMILLSGVSQLNLMSALVRFIPNAGGKTARLVAASYLVATTLALPVAGIAVVIAGRIPALDFLAGNSRLSFLFVASTVVWGVFGLQDSVLTGLRATVWVPLENIVYGVLKIVLLWGLAPLSPDYGIFASWILPVLLLVIPINLLIFRRLIPEHVRATMHQVRSFQWRRLFRYIGGNYLAWLFFLASTRLLPVFVVAIAGARHAAYFYMAWTVASSLRLVVVNMATSLTVEAAGDDRQLIQQSYRFLLNLLRLFVPAVTVIVLAAPLILGLAGRDYQENGVAVLRLLTLSVLPAVINSWYVSVARVRQQVGRIVAVEAGIAALGLIASAILLHALGIVGVGIAWLVGEGAVAAALLAHLIRKRRRPVAAEVQG